MNDTKSGILATLKEFTTETYMTAQGLRKRYNEVRHQMRVMDVEIAGLEQQVARTEQQIARLETSMKEDDNQRGSEKPDADV